MQNLRVIQETVREYYLWIAIGLALSLLFAVRRVTHRKPRKLVEVRDITMSTEGRRMHVNRVFVQRTADALLDAVFAGEITDQEANECYGWLARQREYEEKQPALIKIRKQALLIAELKANKRRRELGKKSPTIPLPEPKPEPKLNETEHPTLAAIFNS